MGKYKKKGNNAGRIDYYGTDEIIQKLDRLGVDVSQALKTALLKSAEKPAREMHDFIAEDHHKSGDTEDSIITSVEEDEDNGKIFVKVGFNLNKEDGKPGLPALFLNYGTYLDLGTPRQEPTNFVSKIIDNNIDEIARVQQQTLEKVAREVGLK